MAYLEPGDWRSEDRELSRPDPLNPWTPREIPTFSTPGATPAAAETSPAGSSFPGIAAYFNANREAAGQMADQMASGLESRATDALKGADVGAAQDVKQDLGLSQTTEGRQAIMQEQAATPTYTPGMSNLDGYMVGRAGRDDVFKQIADYFAPKLDQVGVTPEPAPTVEPIEHPDPYRGPPGRTEREPDEAGEGSPRGRTTGDRPRRGGR